MKKSKMNILACSLMFLIICAKAEEIKIDFDGRSFRAMNIVEMLKTDISASAFEMPARESEPAILDEIDRKELNENLDYSIKSAMEYCRKNSIDEFITDSFKKLLIYGTVNEKYNFVYENKFSYKQIYGRKVEYPARSIPIENISTKEGGLCDRKCIEWSTKEVCINKNVCDNICDAGTLVCIKWDPNKLDCVVWAPVCRIVCRIISDCHDVPVCVKYESTCIFK